MRDWLSKALWRLSFIVASKERRLEILAELCDVQVMFYGDFDDAVEYLNRDFPEKGDVLH